MSEPELLQLSPTEASQLLGAASRVARRARDACHHVWILPALFGIALMVGIEINRVVILPAASAPCLSGARLALGHSCRAVTSTGQLVTVRGGAAPEWSLGTTEIFWLAALPFVLLVFAAIRSRRSSRNYLRGALVTVAGSCTVLSAELLMRLNADVAALANVVAVCLAMGLVAIADRSRSLAAVASGVVAVSVVLAHTVPDIQLQWAGLYVPNTYVMQCAAGVALLGCGVGVRWSRGVTSLGLRVRASRSTVVAGI